MNYDFLNMLNCFCFNTVVFSLTNSGGKGWDGLSAYSPLNRPVFV